MAKVTLHGQSAVLTSTVKMADIEKIQKYEPSLLSLVDEKGKVYFGIAGNHIGEITKYGVTFNDKDAEGYARLTICGISTKQEIIDNFGKTLLNLSVLEGQLAGRLQTLNSTLLTIESQITVL